MKSNVYKIKIQILIFYGIGTYYHSKNDPVAEKLLTRVFNLTNNKENLEIFSKYNLKDIIKIKIIRMNCYFKLYGFTRTIYFLLKGQMSWYYGE